MQGDVLTDTRDHITQRAVEESATRVVPAGSVAVVIRSGILERKLPVATVPFAVALNQDMKGAVPADDVDARWLAWFLRSKEATILRECRKAGTTVASIDFRRLMELQIPVPTLERQSRIVEILEDHLSRLGAAAGYLASAHRRLRGYRDAVLQRLVWSPDVPLVRIEALLAEPMRNGHSASAVSDGDSGVRTLTLTAVTRAEFTEEWTKITKADPGRVADLWLKPGDILIERSNTPELVGTAAMYTGATDWAIFPDLVIRLRADHRMVMSGYLAHPERGCRRGLNPPVSSSDLAM